MSTIFSKILRKEIPADIIYEDELCMAFKDIHPKAPVHLLLIPKMGGIASLDDAPQHQDLMGYLVCKIPQIAKLSGLSKGYKVVINCGDGGGQEIYHLHFHILGSSS